MTKTRLEAFSDAVIAIIITIMVLELKVPHDTSFDTLMKLWPVFLSYAISFLILGIYWGNHHHLVHTIKEVRGGILWANLHLLFWLSLVPFATAWIGESSVAPVPTAVYGAILFMAGVALTIMAAQGPHSPLRAAFGGDKKGWASIVLYGLAVPLAFVNPWISAAIYT